MATPCISAGPGCFAFEAFISIARCASIIRDPESYEKFERLILVQGCRHVAELAYTGKDIDAKRAEKIGLVNDVYDDAEAAQAAALEMAQEIAANAPLAVRGTKFILQQSEDLTTEQSLLLNGLWTMSTTLNSNDLMEAMAARGGPPAQSALQR